MTKQHPLYGYRILHYMNPVRFDTKGIFQHEFDSNYKVLEKTINFLPMCHHYMVVPEKHRIPDNRSNVTLLTYPYSRDAVSNRSHFNGQEFRKHLDFRNIDVDFIFTHQPEMLYNILVAFGDRRYGQATNRFVFFHWVDCPQSRSSTAIPDSYMRQLDSIDLADNAFFHTDIASEWFTKNYNKTKTTILNLDHVKEKTLTFPLDSDPMPEAEPFDLPKDKPILVFNHRWAKSTGVKRMEEYMEGLEDNFRIWCTDSNAPDKYRGLKTNLNRGQYRYLLENSLASICFVDKYATWNLSIQDGLSLGKPVLIYDHLVMRKVASESKNAIFFKTKNEFHEKLRLLGEPQLDIYDWVPNRFETVFENNLITRMVELVTEEKKHVPKDALAWLKCISHDYLTKSEITEQVQENIQYNSVWQYIRRWLMYKGVVDDPNLPFTRYSIPSDFDPQLLNAAEAVQIEFKERKRKVQKSVINHEFF